MSLGVYNMRWLSENQGGQKWPPRGGEGCPYFLFRKRRDTSLRSYNMQAGAQERDSDLGNGPRRVSRHTLESPEPWEGTQ